jgi:hypothetical protein
MVLGECQGFCMMVDTQAAPKRGQTWAGSRNDLRTLRGELAIVVK